MNVTKRKTECVFERIKTFCKGQYNRGTEVELYEL